MSLQTLFLTANPHDERVLERSFHRCCLNGEIAAVDTKLCSHTNNAHSNLKETRVFVFTIEAGLQDLFANPSGRLGHVQGFPPVPCWQLSRRDSVSVLKASIVYTRAGGWLFSGGGAARLAGSLLL